MNIKGRTVDRTLRETLTLTALSIGAILLVCALIAGFPLTYAALNSVGFAPWFMGLSVAHPLWIGLGLVVVGAILFSLLARVAKRH